MSADGDALATKDVRLIPLDVDYAAYRRRVIFECFKWDPQVGDANTISDHACVLSAGTAAYLARLAEALAAETLALEKALARRPDLFAELAIPRTLRSLLQRPAPAEAVRVMRFDFHPTTDGWTVSEVNSDVPGGFAEAGALAQLAWRHAGGAAPWAEPASAIVAGMIERIGRGKRIALIHATAYTDDRQVMQYLANRLGEAGFECQFAAPDHLRWSNGHARSIVEGAEGSVDGIVRFFPAEWMPQLPASSGWRGYFDSQAVMCNPPQALLGQSKRLPLVWDRLGVDVSAWRRTLPETRDPREAPWRRDETWLLKPAFGRVGEDIAWRGGTKAKDWRRIVRSAMFWPRHWIAQKRFESRPLATRAGPRHLCVGVFTVDGRASGFYGRLASGAVVEKHAQDIPVRCQGWRRQQTGDDMELSREEVFDAWAPANSPWSAWAKPVLFVGLSTLPVRGDPAGELPDPGVLSHLRDTAVVLDLPGRKSVLLGLALAQTGFQPVPLFNGATGPGELVDMSAVSDLLSVGAERLKQMKRRPDAPPVFLLNSDRMDNWVSAASPGRYDNRWAVIPQDMPSAEYLMAAGIKRVVVVGALQDDLAHVLYRYQEAKLPVSRAASEVDAPHSVNVGRPPMYKSIWYRLGVFAGLRRNSAGGFGGVTPDPGSAGYGGGFS